MGINIFQVDAFSNKPFGGNPAGVIPDAKGMTGEDMQKVAKEMNVSETAFIEKIGEDYYKVRFFTPEKEVNMCGHATIGAFFILAKKMYITPIDNGIKTVYQDTKIGKLPIYISYIDGDVDRVSMEQAPPVEYGEVKDINRLAKSLGLEVHEIGIEDYNLPPKIISTGIKDIMLPVKTKESLDRININKKELIKVSIDNNVVGVHAFYMPDTDGDKIYARNFAPKVGIDEESATGSANGALIYLLKEYNILKGNSLTAYQGYSMDRPSQIQCEISDENVVLVGGQARVSVDGILMIF